MKLFSKIPSPAHRVTYLDALRILASFLVVLIHVLKIFWLDRAPTAEHFYVASILDTVAYVAVPIFFMISSAIFLNPKFKIETKTTKLAIKYILIFAVSTILYLIFRSIIWYGDAGKIIDQSTGILHYHLWFLPQLIILYFMTPYLRQIINSSDRRQLKYLIKLFISGVVLYSIINAIWSFSAQEPIFADFTTAFAPIFEPFAMSLAVSAGYFLLGYYLHNFSLSKSTTGKLYAAAIGGYILSIYLMITTQTGGVVLSNFFISILLMSSAIFLLFKNHFKQATDIRSGKITTFWAEQTFMIYLIHPFFVDIFADKLNWLSGIDFITRIFLLSILMYLFSFIASVGLNFLKDLLLTRNNR